MKLVEAITRAATGQQTLSPVPYGRGSGGWFPLIRESYSGAWQNNQSLVVGDVTAHHAVFACTTLIASDISKLRLKLTEQTVSGVWEEVENPAYSPVLAKPNHFQTRNQFIENWMLSRLLRGNAYVLKQRDGRGVVAKLYVLDPSRVTPLVGTDGDIWYELRTDNIAGIESNSITVPASEIIHDRCNTLFHPLVGVSPVYACGLAATHGLAIQNSATKLFQNAGRPGGLLIAPGRIDPENADRLKANWDTLFSGDSVGRVAVLGDGLEYKPLSLTAEESQLIEQLKWTAEIVCSVYHVPPYMAGIGQVPQLGNVEALASLYYSQALQSAIEAIESCLDEGLALGKNLGVEFDLDGLLRMDTATQIKALAEAVGGTIMTPNEARKKISLPPVDGGDACYAQQQDFSISALAERDRSKPFSKPGDPAAAVSAGGG